MSEIYDSVEAFEEKLSLPKGFYEDLVKEDDWSFIIKISALFEAACAHALAVRLNAKELEGNFAHLEQANPKYGKIALLKNLGVLFPDQAKFLERLAALRNQVVHNVSNVGVTFKDLIEEMDNNQKKAFIGWVGHGVVEESEIKGKKITRAQFVLGAPKIALSITAAEVLACIYLEVEHATYMQSQSIMKWFET